MSEIRTNHLKLLRLLCVKTQTGEFGLPDVEDLDLVGQIHTLLEDNPLPEEE